MTPKSFFLILIKIMGIFLLYKICMSCADAFSMFHSRWYATEFTFVDKLFVILPYVILFVAIAYFFIVIPNTIIKWRTKDQFQENRIALTKTGLLMLDTFLIDAFKELELSFVDK